MTMSQQTLEGRVALVTGGGQGIGRAICLVLAAQGAYVCVNDIDKSRADSAVMAIAEQGGSGAALAADVSKSAEIDAMFDCVEQNAGMVDLLVNNAGIGGNAAIRNVTNDYWDRVLAIDLNGVLYCTRRALAAMREARRGAIVSVSSRAWLGWWGQSAYATAKAGVVGMTRALAIETSSRNVRLNVVAPGLIDTPMLRNRSEEALARLITSVPMGQLGTPEDIAKAVAFLGSDLARTITGQVLYVCGGKSVYAYPDWPDKQ